MGSHIRMWALCFLKCPSFVEERLCTVSGLQLHKKNSGAGRSLHGKKKCAGVGRVSSSIFLIVNIWQFFSQKIANFVEFTLLETYLFKTFRAFSVKEMTNFVSKNHGYWVVISFSK